jgi:2-polyprenyl-3-methyl-5-hydroxy-6-metoxy-1,4-benzoquinol methylase
MLANPLRRLVQKPEKMFEPYVKPGMTAIDIGSAMGFFTLPLARMVGEHGKVIAVDLQEKMISSLKRRVAKAGLSGRVETRICSSGSLGIDDLAGVFDFVLAFAVMHEMPDPESAFRAMAGALKSGGVLFLGEPTGHVNEAAFEKTTALAIVQGLEVAARPAIWHSHSVVLRKK